MLDANSALEGLASIGLGAWHDRLAALVRPRLADTAHGDLPRWREALAALPPPTGQPPTLGRPVISVGPPAFAAAAREELRRSLLALNPWRKGPFRIGDIHIDAEWRSDRKWSRLEGAVSPLGGRRVLDVGCGNGYYALRMHGAGAAAVVGIDPTLVHLAQFQAVRHWLPPLPVWLLPLRLHELPADSRFFDTVFSMGVLYHRREPLAHLGELHAALRPGGELVLETLIWPDNEPDARPPGARYARMRNVWHLPTLRELAGWLTRQHFVDPVVVDVSHTTTDEQRTTEWMPFESLSSALAPGDSTRTIEGYPAPCRAIVVSTAA
jgi:tRNA (mo5U34)-methyltransferase